MGPQSGMSRCIYYVFSGKVCHSSSRNHQEVGLEPCKYCATHIGFALQLQTSWLLVFNSRVKSCSLPHLLVTTSHNPSLLSPPPQLCSKYLSAAPTWLSIARCVDPRARSSCPAPQTASSHPGCGASLHPNPHW